MHLLKKPLAASNKIKALEYHHPEHTTELLSKKSTFSYKTTVYSVLNGPCLTISS